MLERTSTRPPKISASAAKPPRMSESVKLDMELARRLAIVKCLSAVPDVDYVAVLHQVVFALEAKRSLRAGYRLGSRSQQRVPVDRLSADEVLLQVRMYRS